jgi:hypothetical protein
MLPDISYFTDLRHIRSAKNIPKTVLKTRFITNHVYFDFVKNLVPLKFVGYSVITCSTLVNFYLLVILYVELLLKKAAIYGVKKMSF